MAIRYKILAQKTEKGEGGGQSDTSEDDCGASRNRGGRIKSIGGGGGPHKGSCGGGCGQKKRWMGEWSVFFSGGRSEGRGA